MSISIFSTNPGFCADCGSILPVLRDVGNIQCYTCKKEYPVEVFGNLKVNYTVHFNSVEAQETIDENEKQRKDNENEGPIVERKCPKCGNETMSYATLQLRSADEGQTVFYTCTKCQFKETENS